jgi:TctA family transporter
MTDINSSLSGLYNVFKASMPTEIQLFITVFAFAILISLYVIFILKFSKFIATKDFLKLNLKKYNTSQHQVVSFLLGIVFYFTEYILFSHF